MYGLWKLFRSFVSVVLLVLVLVPAIVYGLLSTPAVQERLRRIAQTELSALLDADVSIGRVSISPFTKVNIYDVSLVHRGDTIASLDAVNAALELRPLIFRGKFIVDYTLIDGASVHLRRDSAGAPLNIQPIIDHLKKPDSNDRPAYFDLQISTLVVRNAMFSYDVASEPCREGRFDPNHISVTGLGLNAYIPRISSENYDVSLDHLGFGLADGSFILRDLRLKADIGSDQARVSGLTISLPQSRLALAPITLSYESLKDISVALRTDTLAVATTGDCHITPSDLRTFVPALGAIDQSVNLRMNIRGLLSDLEAGVEIRTVNAPRAVEASLHARVQGLPQTDSLYIDLRPSHVDINGPALSRLLGDILPQKHATTIARAGDARSEIDGGGSPHAGHADISIHGLEGTASQGRY